jgi:hypothetical protein
MKLILLLVVIVMVWSSMAWGQSTSLNLAIPQSQQSYQSDRIRAGDIECSMAIGSSTNVEFGVVGILNQNNPFSNTAGLDANSAMMYNDWRDDNRFIRDVGVYSKITIPIGAPKERLDCNKLYQLELEKKRLEVQKLRQEVRRLQSLQFDN